jgi:hypothetical protein
MWLSLPEDKSANIMIFSNFYFTIFFPAILSAVVFFRNTTAGGKISCLKIDRDKNRIA